MESQEKSYEIPRIQFLPLPMQDVLTASTPIFEVEPDTGEWDNEM